MPIKFGVQSTLWRSPRAKVGNLLPYPNGRRKSLLRSRIISITVEYKLDNYVINSMARIVTNTAAQLIEAITMHDQRVRRILKQKDFITNFRVHFAIVPVFSWSP